MNFYYEAIGENNEIIKDEKVASSEDEIASFLKLKKYTIITIEKEEESKSSSSKISEIFSSGVSINEKANFTRNLATMIKSGLPIAEAIGIIAEDSKSRKFKTILTEIKYDLESGRPLSQALAKYPQVFDKIFISLIGAGELSGKIPDVLTSLFKYITKDIRLRTKIISAFTYPIVVLIALVLMGFVMLILVVPKILEVFTRMKIDLPLPLKILQFITMLFIQFWYISFPILILILIGIIIFFKSNLGKKFCSFIMRKTPYLSKLSKAYDMARITSTLSLLLRSGVPMTDSLRIVSVGVVDIDLKQVIKDTEKQVKEGKSLSKAFSNHSKQIPNMLIKITKVGEKSGKMDQVLAELGQFYDEQVDNMLKTMSDLIEPALMLIVGLVVAALVLSIISPIYGLVGSFSGQ